MSERNEETIERVANVLPDVVKRIQLAIGYSRTGNDQTADAYVLDVIDELRLAAKALRDSHDPLITALIPELDLAATEVQTERDAACARLNVLIEILWQAIAAQRKNSAR